MASKAETPGALYRIPIGVEDHAYAVMLALPGYVAFYSNDVEFSDTGSPIGAPLFVLIVAKSAYARGRWGSPIRYLKPHELIDIPKFFWQNVGVKSDCKIIDPASHRRISAKPADCLGLEREAVWEYPHIESRIADSYANRPNAFAESLRPRM